MNVRFYWLTRNLHLYLGLFFSPFVLVFSVSVFFFVHSWLAKSAPESIATREVQALDMPENLSKLSGRQLIEALRPALAGMKVPGEVGFVRHQVKEQKLIIPVSIPGRATTVTIDLARRAATISTRETGLADALMTLHESPGPHGPDIRKNWLYMRVWSWFADATAYLILFISVSGIYLWYVLRAERRIGLILLAVGTLTFFGLAYAVSH